MFYVGGGLCLLFCIVWQFTVYDSPAEHPRISQRELQYINKSLEGTQLGKVVLHVKNLTGSLPDCSHWHHDDTIQSLCMQDVSVTSKEELLPLCLIFKHKNSLSWCWLYDKTWPLLAHVHVYPNYELLVSNAKFVFQNTYVPWRAIITSPAMWAIITAHFCNNFGNYTLITKLPAFMKEVLKFDIKAVSSSGLHSAMQIMDSEYLLSLRIGGLQNVIITVAYLFLQ